MSRHMICPVCWSVVSYDERQKLQPMHEDYWLEHIGKEHHPFDLVMFAMDVFNECYESGKFEVER